MAATATQKKGAKKAPIKHAAPARKKAAAPARKKAARVVAKKPAAAAPAAPKKRTDYFRTYQANRRADAAKAEMCIECTTQPRAVEKNAETGKYEVISSRCIGCLDRARDSMRAKRALEA